MRNKRGFELTWQFFFNLLFVLAIMVLVALWIYSQSSGAAVKKQILAKETCLLATAASPNTIITIEHEKSTTIEKQGTNILVKDGQFDRGYLYECYLQDNVMFSQKDNLTIIEIR